MDEMMGHIIGILFDGGEKDAYVAICTLMRGVAMLSHKPFAQVVDEVREVAGISMLMNGEVVIRVE